MEKKRKRMKELAGVLNEAAKIYYQGTDEIISNFEYDKLYDELSSLEKETGMILSNSPTAKVGYEVLSELPKERHEFPMLSLDKTKERETFVSWLGEKDGILSWKLDGLTVVLTYEAGVLKKAVTRGNGEVGEVITNNARVFKNLPGSVSFMGKLVIRGEAVIRYSNFHKINQEIKEEEAKYKNPRNLCSGSVRQLNNEITAKRKVEFMAFSLVIAEGAEFFNSREAQMNFMKSLGFDVVEGIRVNKSTIAEQIKWFSDQINENDYPTDGLVLLFDDIEYGHSLGKTSKFPKDAIAFKWADEIRETTLVEIEWSASRTGLINPVAIFEPVELEGTCVSRASLHNISIIEGLEMGIGDKIQVYKANMIIPQVAENLTRSRNLEIPEECPVCKERTIIKQDNGVKSLHCPNEKCLAKQIKAFTHFVSRDAMNIEGLSEATIEKLISAGMLRTLSDLYHLDDYKEQIIQMEGLGEKSYQNLMNSIKKSRETTLSNFIYSLGISNIGLSNAKLICKEWKNDLEKIRNANQEALLEITGIGEVIARFFVDFFKDKENEKLVDALLKEVHFRKEEEETNLSFTGLNFVITGSLEHFPSRKEMKELIEGKGGKVTGSVTSKTNYLINNDNTSNSSKNKKARELGITVITEEEFLQILDKNDTLIII